MTVWPERTERSSAPWGLAEALGLLVASAAWLWILAGFPIPTGDLPIVDVDIRHLELGAHLAPPSLRSFFESGYPPLTYLFTWPFYEVLGRTVSSAFLSVTVLTALLAPASYLLARSFLGPACGWVAFLLTAGSNLAISLSGGYQTEQMVALLTSLFLASYFASRRLTRPWAVVLCGVLLGLGLLAKMTLVFFTGLALLEGSWLVLREQRWGARHLVPWPVALLSWGAAMLLWSTILQGGGLVALLAGELSLALLAAWLACGRPSAAAHGAGRLKSVLLALTLAVALAGPYYVAGFSQVATRAEGYWVWREMGLRTHHATTLDVPMIPEARWLLPLGVLALACLGGARRREGLLLVAQVALGLLLLLGMRLADDRGGGRFLLPAVPLLAVVAGASSLWLRRWGSLAPFLVLALLLSQYSPEAWARARREKLLGKAIFKVGERDERGAPVLQLMARRLQEHRELASLCGDDNLVVLCPSSDSYEKALTEATGLISGDYSQLLIYLELHQHRSDVPRLVPADLQRGAPWPVPRPEFFLTATRSLEEEAALLRDGEAALGVRLERVEGAAGRDGRLGLWRAVPGTGTRSPY